MPEHSPKLKKSSIWARLASFYARLSYEKPWLPLLVLALFTAFSLYLGQKLKIDTNLRVLLPKDTPSVQALLEAEHRKGSTDLFTIAIQDPSPEVVARLQQIFQDSIRTWEETVWAQSSQEKEYFAKRALLYFPVSQLVDLKKRLENMVAGEFQNSNPFLVSLLDDLDEPDDAQPKEKGLEGWPDMEALKKEGLPPDILASLKKELQKGQQNKSQSQASENEGSDISSNNSTTNSAGVTKESSGAEEQEVPAPLLPDSLSDRLMGWHGARNAWVGVVLSQLNQPSTDADFAKAIYERGEALIERVQASGEYPNAKIVVAGAYRNFREIKEIGHDIVVAGTISLSLMMALLFFFLRRPLPLLLINIPLFAAMAWTTAAAYLMYQRLTLLTAFILALILGLGIEYTIHLYSRWAEESRKGLSPIDAMTAALIGTGRALLSGAATNIVAMLSLQAGHFQGFREYGVIVSAGIGLCLMSTWLMIPPTFFLFQRLGDVVNRHLGGPRWFRSTVEWFMPGSGEIQGGKLIPYLNIPNQTWAWVGGLVAVATIALSFAPPVQFENDFRNLRGKSTGAGISYGRAVGAGKNTSPAVILGKDEKQMRVIHDSLALRSGRPEDSMMVSFVTLQSFIPPQEKQADRMEIIKGIDSLLSTRALAERQGETGERLALLKQYTTPSFILQDSLPGWAKRFLGEADGNVGRIGYIYAEMRESDAVESSKFQKGFSELEADGEKVPVASTGFIYADVVNMVKNDGLRLAIITFLLLIIIVYIDMRDWRGVLVVVGFISLSAWWTYCLMGLIGLKLGMFNLVVLPTLLSVSVDSVIHLYHRRLELGAGKISELLSTTGSAVLAGTLNNAFGFMGLCFVDHKGMQTIGLLATLGIGTGLLLLFTLIPVTIEWLCPKEPQLGLGGE